MRDKTLAGALQFVAQFAIVVENAVEYDHAAGACVSHGLITRCTEVNDGQSPMTKGQRPRVPLTGMIWPACCQRRRHARHGVKVGSKAVEAQFSANSAHIVAALRAS